MIDLPKGHNILLIGMMGCGKTTIGKKMAEKIGYSHLDTDTSIANAHSKSIHEIFNNEGEDVFRKMEKDIIRDLPKTQCVISTGGGMPCYFNNIALLKQNGLTVYLDTDVELLFARLKNKNNRPLFSNQMVQFEQFLQNRISYYEKAHVTIQATNKNPSKIIDEILENVNY